MPHLTNHFITNVLLLMLLHIQVWVSDAEAAYIARYLNLPLVRFLALHCRAYSKVEGFRLLRSNMDSEVGVV
jgi:hypothetical protein